jgi:serine/threonine protein kinase
LNDEKARTLQRAKTGSKKGHIAPEIFLWSMGVSFNGQGTRNTPKEVTLREGRSTLTPSKWSKVREIYALVVNQPLESRAATAVLLAEGDSELESEVISLLAAHEEVGDFLAEPVIAAFGIPIIEAARLLNRGTVLNRRFEIQRFLNSGGMGSVYEAWDGELKEMVALKTILPDLASDPSALQFFKEEVKQARRISHPNICRVYDLFCHEQPSCEPIWFLTMQLLHGRTLQEHLRGDGPFAPGDALVLTQQLISGLTAAHELGIVHRDFKSANIILVASTGQALIPVITDFGIASRITANLPDSHTPKGQGSPAYVAPEQWYEGIVGPAADQFSLGVVMCEMVTGKRPALTRIASDESLTVELPEDSRLSGRWYSVIHRCVEPKPEMRFPSLAAIINDLDPSRRRRVVKHRLILTGVAALLISAVFLATTAMSSKPVIHNLKQLTPIMDLSTSPSLSRDGRTIAYASDRFGTGSSDIWVEHLPDGIPVRVTDDAFGDEDPSLSPDGQKVVFVSTRDRGGIYLASTEGGPAKLLVAGGRNPRFAPDGRSVLYWTGDDNRIRAAGHLYVFNLDAGRSIQLAPEFADARDAIWNSDGRHILFKGCAPGHATIPACWEWWVTTIDGQTPRDTGALAVLAKRHLTLAGEFGGWYGDTILFTAASGRAVHLWELRVPPTRSTVTGLPRELTPGDEREKIISSSLSGGDVIAFTEFSSAVHIWRIEPGDIPQTPKLFKVTQDAEIDIDPSISSNGRWLTFARGASVDRRIWIRDMLADQERIFPAEGSDKFSPVVDDAGSTLAYETWQNGVSSILIESPGAASPSVLCKECRAPTGWFGGKEGLLVSDASLSRVEMYRPATGELQTILQKPRAYVAEATWSPANEFVLFTVSDAHGHGQAFAAHFPRGARAPDSDWIPITPSSESVQRPRWSGNGRTIYYLSNRDNAWCLWRESFDPAAKLAVGKPLNIQHYHSHRFSPASVSSHSLNLSVAGDSVYLNIAEMSGTIWTGKVYRAFARSILDKF